MSQQQIKEYLINRIVDCLADYLIEDYGLSLEEALKKVYSSDTYSLLLEGEDILTSQSPAYIYSYLQREL